jgi:hypothetical protein
MNTSRSYGWYVLVLAMVVILQKYILELMLLVAFFQISKTTYLSSKNSEENSRCRQ